MSHSEQMIWQCAAEVKNRYAGEAEKTVQRQIAWSRERGADSETAFWDAVLGRLAQSRAKSAEVAETHQFDHGGNREISMRPEGT